MATEGEATFSAAAAAPSSNEAARGVGGKLKRQTARRHSATPYSRPPQNQVQRRPWISRIVDPAYRIISGGATRILPYFFSKAASAPALTAPDDQDQHQDKLQDDPQENDPSIAPSLNNESGSIEEGGTSGTANVNEGNFNISAQIRGKTPLSGVVAISELERLMEGKTFSQAETDRLIEIITSRAIDLPDVKRDDRNLEMPLRKGAEIHKSFLDKRKDPIGGKDANSGLWATPSPLAKSTILDGDKQIRDEAGLSPAELAKAYMGGQTSSSSSLGFVTRNEKDGFDGGILGAKSSFASPPSKPSTCWPGIKLSEQCGFDTPQSQRGSFGLQNLPRTPYSRTILPNSKSKLMQLQDDSSKRLNTLQSPSQSVQTRYGQLKFSKGRDSGLFGPNRRSRQSATPSMVSPYSRPSSGASRRVNSAIMKSSEEGELSNLSRSQTTTYSKYIGLEVGTPTVPTHSSQLSRRILDHINRQPTPKDKSAELKLSTSWRYSESSKTVEQNSLNGNNVKIDNSAKLSEDTRNIFSQYPPSSVLKTSAVTTGPPQSATIKTTSSSNGTFHGTQETVSSGTTLQLDLGKPKASLSRSTHEELVNSSQDAAKSVPYSLGGEPANLPKPPSDSVGNNKRVLASISVAKPYQRWAVSSGSNAGFSFPIPSCDGASSSEPTTPSIMPFTTSPAPRGGGGVAITSHDEARKDDEIPQFDFGGNRGGDKSAVVFAFPSVSEEVSNEDDEKLGIKFTFGSAKPERISFSSAGSDGVCC